MVELPLKLKVSFKPMGSAVATRPRVPARVGGKRRGWKFYLLVGAGVPSAILFVVCSLVLVAVSLATPPPPAEQTDGLTFATTPASVEGTVDRSRDRTNAMLSGVLVLAVFALWLYFSG